MFFLKDINEIQINKNRRLSVWICMIKSECISAKIWWLPVFLLPRYGKEEKILQHL